MVNSVRDIASGVLDPELPLLTIDDLGILREAHAEGNRAVVTITPTYSACPALDAIRDDIANALRAAGWTDIDIHTVFAPAWTTDWISDSGREKLKRSGISPPGAVSHEQEPARVHLPMLPPQPPRCPRCEAVEVEQLSRFGPAACLALWRCLSCAEPFEHFKTH